MIIAEQVLKSLIDLRKGLNIPLIHVELGNKAKHFVIYNASGTTTTFHFTVCVNVQRAVKNNSIALFRRTSNTSGVFKLLNGKTKEFNVCPFCLEAWAYGNGWEGYGKASPKDRARIKSKFTISRFFAKIAALSDSDIWKGLEQIPPEIPEIEEPKSEPASKSPSEISKIIVPGCYVIYTPRAPGAGFHVTECSVLKADCAHEWTGGYRTTSDLSGIFTVYINTSGNDTKQKTLIPSERKLKVCPVCLAEFNNNHGWKGFSLNDEQKNLVKAFTLEGRSKILDELLKTLDKSQKAAIRKFNIQEFFKACDYKSQIPDEILSRIWACRVDPENRYPSNWTEISRLNRIISHYRCDECGAELSNNKKLVVLHHIDGLHPNVKGDNFRVLCKMCHAKQWRHEHTPTPEEIQAIEAHIKSPPAGKE